MRYIEIECYGWRLKSLTYRLADSNQLSNELVLSLVVIHVASGESRRALAPVCQRLIARRPAGRRPAGGRSRTSQGRKRLPGNWLRAETELNKATEITS